MRVLYCSATKEEERIGKRAFSRMNIRTSRVHGGLSVLWDQVAPLIVGLMVWCVHYYRQLLGAATASSSAQSWCPAVLGFPFHDCYWRTLLSSLA